MRTKFAEAWWLPLDVFIEEAGGNPSQLRTPEKKIEYAKKLGAKQISWDDGQPGVIQNLHADGRKKLHIGVRSGTSKRQDSCLKP